MRYVLIAIMGFIGAFARYALQVALPPDGFPAATFLINIIGCFLLEIIYSYFGRRTHLPRNLVSGMGVGLLGAFTTLSAFTTDTANLLMGGSYLLAAINVIATLICCFAATMAGHYTSRLMAARRLRKLLARRAERREVSDNR